MDRVTGALIGLAIAAFFLFCLWQCELRRSETVPASEVASAATWQGVGCDWTQLPSAEVQP